MLKRKGIALVLVAIVILGFLAEPMQAVSRTEQTIRAQPGDCLWRIARRYGTTVDVLARYNGITHPDRLLVDQRIVIPMDIGRRRTRTAYASRSYVSPLARRRVQSISERLFSMVQPVADGRLTSGYGMRWGRMHRGIDLACPVGTKIKATSAGKIVGAGWRQGYGWLVEIDHGGWRTRYAHNSRLLVAVGDVVRANETIALSGATGRATGPHLHFEVILNGRAVDPAPYLKI